MLSLPAFLLGAQDQNKLNQCLLDSSFTWPIAMNRKLFSCLTIVDKIVRAKHKEEAQSSDSETVNGHLFAGATWHLLTLKNVSFAPDTIYDPTYSPRACKNVVSRGSDLDK